MGDRVVEIFKKFIRALIDTRCSKEEKQRRKEIEKKMNEKDKKNVTHTRTQARTYTQYCRWISMREVNIWMATTQSMKVFITLRKNFHYEMQRLLLLWNLMAINFHDSETWQECGS